MTYDIGQKWSGPIKVGSRGFLKFSVLVYAVCTNTPGFKGSKEGDRAGGGSDKEECADGIQCRQSMVPFWSVFEVHPLYQFCCKG